MILSIKFISPTIASIIRASLLSIFLFYYTACSSPSKTHTQDTLNLDFGFYTSFAPISYSADGNLVSNGSNIHLGYEAELLTALEVMEDEHLSFTRHPIPIWDNIWLKPTSDKYDLVGGGITILDSRTRDTTGEKRVAFTSGHITFRQSLLVRAEDEKRIAHYDNLNNNIRVGVLAGTTGESRLLQLTRYADANGILIAGTRIDTPQGVVTADGSENYFITAGKVSSNLDSRQRLYHPLENMPQVVYLGYELGETELFDALAEKRIDAIARGGIGNHDYAHASGGTFVVTALDPKIEHGGFTIAIENTKLLSWINRRINWLTDHQRIGYKEWKKDSLVFIRRANIWKMRVGQ